MISLGGLDAKLECVSETQQRRGVHGLPTASGRIRIFMRLYYSRGSLPISENPLLSIHKCSSSSGAQMDIRWMWKVLAEHPGGKNPFPTNGPLNRSCLSFQEKKLLNQIVPQL